MSSVRIQSENKSAPVSSIRGILTNDEEPETAIGASSAADTTNSAVSTPIGTKSRASASPPSSAGVVVSALPGGSYELPASAEASIQAMLVQQQLQNKFLLDPIGSVHVSALRAIASNDTEILKGELKTMMQRYDSMKVVNANLLQRVQSLKGNIQVCCRARPPLLQELKQGARVCVDVIENDIAWFDKRSNAWKSFTFDRVWSMDSMQADVFADVEPLALSVVDGYNACILGILIINLYLNNLSNSFCSMLLNNFNQSITLLNDFNMQHLVKLVLEKRSQ